jgi:hypothetical protein
MKKLKKFGVQLKRNELKELIGGNEFTHEGGPKWCVVKSCKDTFDCDEVSGCACRFNSPNDSWGYCQKR